MNRPPTLTAWQDLAELAQQVLVRTPLHTPQHTRARHQFDRALKEIEKLERERMENDGE